jgi:hypothetical protein
VRGDEYHLELDYLRAVHPQDLEEMAQKLAAQVRLAKARWVRVTIAGKYSGQFDERISMLPGEGWGNNAWFIKQLLSKARANFRLYMPLEVELLRKWDRMDGYVYGRVWARGKELVVEVREISPPDANHMRRLAEKILDMHGPVTNVRLTATYDGIFERTFDTVVDANDSDLAAALMKLSRRRWSWVQP